MNFNLGYKSFVPVTAKNNTYWHQLLFEPNEFSKYDFRRIT
jgi:hypothetical protein